ncbi:MAG: SDR family oxidoreductase [Hyphomicrobiales bacterium]|nr:SDR family oxidoreductase [Hyphomicrobiales bacterium]
MALDSKTLFVQLGLKLGSKPDQNGRTPLVLVTGASEGIGYELALRFAREGHDIMAVARSAATLQAASQRIRDLTGQAVHAVAADISSQSGLDIVDEALSQKNAYVFILVNNAGVGYGGEFASQAPEEMRRLIDLNMYALTELTRRYLPGMRSARHGGVLNLGSLGGFYPGPYQAIYYASKAYVRSLTNALAWEVWGSGVRFSVVSPGPVHTDFHQKAGVGNANYLKFPGIISAERVARSAYHGFFMRRRVIVPGTLVFIASVFSRAIPTFIITPFIGWLLKKRY